MAQWAAISSIVLPCLFAGDTRNIGTSAPSVVITDVTQIRASDYALAYDGAQWQLTRLTDNSSVTGAGTTRAGWLAR